MRGRISTSRSSPVRSSNSRTAGRIPGVRRGERFPSTLGFGLACARGGSHGCGNGDGARRGCRSREAGSGGAVPRGQRAGAVGGGGARRDRQGSEALEEVLREVGVGPDDYTTTGVSVQEEREYEGERTVHRGYRARDNVVVRLSDPSAAGSLMRLAAQRSAARIAGPRWRMDSDNPARAEACRRAAADARRRAKAYAQTLGARLGAIVEINETQGRLRGRYGRLPSGFALAASGEEPEVGLHPGNFDVAAEVDVTFALEQE